MDPYSFMKKHRTDADIATAYRGRFSHLIWVKIVQLVYAFLGPRFVGWMAVYNDQRMHVRIVQLRMVRFLEVLIQVFHVDY